MNNNFYQMNEIDKQKYRKEQEKAYFEKLLGDDFLKLLKDSFITEIMLNNDEEKHLWIDKFGEGMVETNITVNNVEALKIIENVANLNKKVVNDENPILSGSLPNGERFEAIIGECVNFSPIMAIRKPPTQIFTLDQYVEKNVITAKQKDFIIQKFINERKNILIVGGTSSGKTTFANACLEQLTNTKDRIVIIEDTQELQCKARNIVRLKSTYKILTSVDLDNTLKFAKYLNEINKPTWLRYVLVPGYSDDENDLHEWAKFTSQLKNVERVDVLPFHQMGQYKWEKVGKEYKLKDTPTPTRELVEKAEEIFRSYGLKLLDK